MPDLPKGGRPISPKLEKITNILKVIIKVLQFKFT